MAARNKARKRAFQILFEADQRGAGVRTVLADWIRHAQTDDRQPPVNAYTARLVEGYDQYAERIDELISTYAVGWALDRMPVVDRNILRLAAYELVWEDETPDAVAIDEAVQLAREFSTDESPSFVNGLLGRFQEIKPSLRRDGQPAAGGPRPVDGGR
ncbi:transcription antitermination factor NusB [Streptomyces sp. B1866]|uniref:transcription antitermination factor NusB n=1 Tax=Streptomyces sp. B1866 TaxID=3075431 RepID=UPI002891DE66|nr:transcription antitermination factor NusB [Streptomyces sp. B1866]MDT3398216.1 transcription antitermination factor NusB [Streptomyces sp. B1866]